MIPFWLDRPPLEALEVAAVADGLGYDELWIGEMLHFDAMALAGAIVASTRRVTITVGPLALALRDPVLLGMGIASIAELGGRAARLALGASSRVLVERWHGKAWGGEADRIREAVVLIRSVLEGARTDLQGIHFRSRGFRTPLGPHEPHISVAAIGPKMLAAASEVADRLVLNLVPPEVAAEVVGRTNLPVAVWVAAAVDPTEAGWLQLAHQVALYLRVPGYRRVLRAAGMGELIEASRRRLSQDQIVERMTSHHLKRVAAVGNLEEVNRLLKAYEEAGATVMVVPVTADDPGGRRTLAALAPGNS